MIKEILKFTTWRISYLSTVINTHQTNKKYNLEPRQLSCVETLDPIPFRHEHLRYRYEIHYPSTSLLYIVDSLNCAAANSVYGSDLLSSKHCCGKESSHRVQYLQECASLIPKETEWWLCVWFVVEINPAGAGKELGTGHHTYRGHHTWNS